MGLIHDTIQSHLQSKNISTQIQLMVSACTERGGGYNPDKKDQNEPLGKKLT